MQVKGTKFDERATASKEAKMALLARAKALNPANDPAFAERQAARAEAARIRDEREATKKAAKAEAARIAEEERKVAEARQAEEKLLEDARLELEREQYEREQALLVLKQKMARDARYAARKARTGSSKR
jgi:predicted  nucleic acid-binding Zn-ribbon protein